MGWSYSCLRDSIFSINWVARSPAERRGQLGRVGQTFEGGGSQDSKRSLLRAGEGVTPQKAVNFRGSVEAQLKSGATNSRPQPAEAVTSPRSSPGACGKLHSKWAYDRGTTGMSPFASALAGFLLLCSSRCACPPGSSPALGSLRTKHADGEA